MKKLNPAEKKQLKGLNDQVKVLEKELVVAKKKEGIDQYVSIKSKKQQAKFQRVKIESGRDKATGTYMIEIAVTAKTQPVYIPLTIASGKTTSGFMYHINGTDESSIGRAGVVVTGEGVKRITIGSLDYAELAPKVTGLFQLEVVIKGRVGQTYQIIVNRINYKLTLTDPRYQQYLKPIESKVLRFA
ncbi:MAG: hypothetical protein RLZZ70_182 [Candidatus Parcubacteria bacterium]|jgi:hypothetical protein